jgi:hypothetical protein
VVKQQRRRQRTSRDHRGEDPARPETVRRRTPGRLKRANQLVSIVLAAAAPAPLQLTVTAADVPAPPARNRTSSLYTLQQPQLDIVEQTTIAFLDIISSASGVHCGARLHQAMYPRSPSSRRPVTRRGFSRLNALGR